MNLVNVDVFFCVKKSISLYYKMPGLDLYLSELDSATSLLDAGTFTGINTTPALANTHVNLYAQMPAAKWRRAFKFLTDNSVDADAEEASFIVNQARDLIGGGGANVSTPANPVWVDSSTVDYVDYQITDKKTSPNSTGDAQVDFVSELARAVFGAKSAVDLFTNEEALATAYRTAVFNAINLVTAKFATTTPSSGATIYSSLASGADNQRVVKKIYDQMRLLDVARFSMMYGAEIEASVTGLVLTTVDATRTVAPTTVATLKLEIVSSVVTQLYVVSTGAGYAAGDTISFKLGGSAKANIATLTDIQASILNGTLNTATELPFMVGDLFHIKLTISNNSGQTNSSGNQIGATAVQRTVDLHIKLA